MTVGYEHFFSVHQAFECQPSNGGGRSFKSRRSTKQSSYPSEWFCAFAQLDRLITLHLHDERRVAGWPAEWPPESANGQFLIHNPRWLDASGQTVPFGAEFLLIDSAKVKWVEFSPASEGLS
ncbi:hypothetical protein [Pseudomonas fluorescens]|uniref:hypothetical protein n=1 Tax=Pseudomonas fluorescens TaxID=294 RepID=UPI00223B65F2|nr:hypothetical protein [Pseudomonas fluorescens]